LSELTDRRGELELELAAPALYEPSEKARLLVLLERKNRLDADLEEAEIAWLETGEELERKGAEPL
jgi:hypothetical protein